MKHIGVIDIGKTNAKFALVDAGTMREIAVRTRPNTVIDTAPYPHYDIEGIWHFLCEAIAEINRANPVDALSITTHGATAALVDPDGRLSLPVLDYEFTGPDSDRAAYDALCPPFTESLTPKLPAGLNLGAQLHYQTRHWPDAFARTNAILAYPQYWAFRLTGTLASERTSLGCHTGLWDFQKQTFSPLVERLGVEDKFPPLRSAFDQLGSVKTELAEQLGLRPVIPVCCGIHDSNASLLPHILTAEPPFSVVSTGTWVIVCSPGGSIEELDEQRDCLANIDALGRTVPSARFMGGREFSLLTGGGARQPSSSAIDSVLANELLLLPAIQQGSGPFPNSEPVWTGGGDALDADTRYVIVSFYLALMTAECLKLTSAKGKVIVEGPFARNPLYLEMLHAAVGRGVFTSEGNATGTSVGAALLALGPHARPALDYGSIASANDGALMSSYARRWRALALNRSSL